MLRITKQTDYAIMLLARMSQSTSGRWMTARDAADWSGLSLPMVSKILKSLARAGVIVSHRGAGGGYGLARPAHETNVADVIRALEGPIGVVECAAQPGACDQEPICPARVNWGRINRAVESALEDIPISQMVTCQDGTHLLSLQTLGGAESDALENAR